MARLLRRIDSLFFSLLSLGGKNPTSRICVLLFFSWFLWRIWKFSVAPKWYPNRPKTYPYWIPFVGHTLSFFRDGDGTIMRARMYFKNDRAPFKLVIMGETVYVVTSPQDTASVHRQIENLSMDNWIKELMVQFGATSASINAMWSPKAMQSASKEPLAHVCQLLFRLQLNPGEYSNQVQERVLRKIHERMTWEEMPTSMILSEAHNSRVISLLHWSQNVLLQGATTSFFGKALLEVEPELFKYFFKFDESSWKLSYRIPPLLAKDLLRAKSFAQDAMQRYFDLPAASRADASWLVQSIEAKMRASGIPSRDIGRLVLMFYWTINANAWKSSFWMLTYIINDSNLRQSILDEVTPLLANNSLLSPVELAAQLCECLCLTSVYNEVLRLTASSVSVRTVVGPAAIGDLVLEKDARIVVPYRQMLLDEAVFGPDTNEFNHERFLQNPSLAKSSSFKPFGGGVTLCPGRQLAQREVLSFVALALCKFDLNMGEPLSNSHRNVPELEARIPCIGIMGPVAGQDVHTRVIRV
ncbi:cytochrome P450 [Lindgomyces ingoldianus]|uniref:Cytochrome P450 n=1 Tax=Lindgomyces ingoldianus TaxID=673940 RepID=A0ACB6RIR2_9PLEO|nr:cytochrome P450 [Lindgomyces ingoldianus]KAF2478407.1 cytochrome P450 [Lindgomyces ingoldianus]